MSRPRSVITEYSEGRRHRARGHVQLGPRLALQAYRAAIRTAIAWETVGALVRGQAAAVRAAIGQDIDGR